MSLFRIHFRCCRTNSLAINGFLNDRSSPVVSTISSTSLRGVRKSQGVRETVHGHRPAIHILGDAVWALLTPLLLPTAFGRTAAYCLEKMPLTKCSQSQQNSPIEHSPLRKLIRVIIAPDKRYDLIVNDPARECSGVSMNGSPGHFR